jgi:hypothetical protein
MPGVHYEPGARDNDSEYSIAGQANERGRMSSGSALRGLSREAAEPARPSSYSETAASMGASAVSRSGDSPIPWWASQRSASRAAMQPVPAAVTAWR